jgi:N6-adenosine-specific RNA methylase IME4
MGRKADTAQRGSAARQAQAALQLRPSEELRLHEQAELVPRMPADQYRAFKADIAERGICRPVEITSAGVVLDGRERLQAAQGLGIGELPVRVVAPADEQEYMLLCALKRRQLSASQRAALALELELYRQLREEGERRRLQNLRQLSEVAKLPPRGKTRELAADSERTLQDAITVQAHDPELFQQVKQGRLAVDVAARRVRRLRRDQALPPAPPLPEGPFSLIYADPPWQLGSPDGLYAPERHYPTMSLEELSAIELPVAEEALLLLWAVNMLLPEALQLIEAWGFQYKTNLVWVKPSIGQGYWARNRHELLLLATRGRFPLAEPDCRPDSVIEAPRGRHSQKPAGVYELIECAWPQVAKLELFARQARPGWAAWGNQLRSPAQAGAAAE